MDVHELLTHDSIVMRGGASSKRQALHLIAEAAADRIGASPARILDALLEREALGSTGLGSGVAVPHARMPEVEAVFGVFMRLETPVAYDAIDDRPVDLVFALFAPSAAGAEHLRALAAVSRMMRSSELREKLRRAHTLDALHALFLKEAPADAA